MPLLHSWRCPKTLMYRAEIVVLKVQSASGFRNSDNPEIVLAAEAFTCFSALPLCRKEMAGRSSCIGNDRRRCASDRLRCAQATVWAAPQSVQECCSGSFAWPELPPLRPRVPMPLARAIFRSHFQPQLVQIFLAGRLLLFRGWLLCCDFPEPGSLGQIIGH